jgi:hypothetical protein
LDDVSLTFQGHDRLTAILSVVVLEGQAEFAASAEWPGQSGPGSPASAGGLLNAPPAHAGPHGSARVPCLR